MIEVTDHTRAMMRTGWIYFIKPRGQAGPIKIGFSKSLGERFGSISTASPLLLEIIGSTPGSLEDERFLHRCFAEQHSHGEWFYPSAALHAAIENILQKGIQFARETLTEKGKDRPWARRKRSDLTKSRMSASMRKQWALRRARLAEPKS
ncbi:GIY-YIG nuclease family protein [Bradyrhizobium genosp. L]|uniref:GIY-YIG nuclease family protein n=1 Tax=Bradyrhizobium genosp. L TaxID=83637 RepID=UPI0018A25B83|nr:GIY-YIG nuclease family protein [Bradyrhizobium genosp. L]QPF81635.1 GIY-YIG nuclease family protein [Bradyrhizobium genosp. L]